MGYRGFRLPLRPQARPGCGCPNARPTTTRSRRSPPLESSSSSSRPIKEISVARAPRVARRRTLQWRQRRPQPRGFSLRPRIVRHRLLRRRHGRRRAPCRMDRGHRARARAGAALMIATDGETFGHHKKHGAAELARALMALASRDDIVITNCEDYLASHPAAGSFEIPAATSWSCPHGVERWRSNCGCRADAHTSQEWRAPFRAAMDFVKSSRQGDLRSFRASAGE